MKTQKPRTILPVLTIAVIFAGISLTATAATPAEIEQAIDDGITWLATQQNPSSGYWQDSGSTAGPTGLALVKLQERAFELGYTPFDPCYPYSENVEKGFAYLFSNMGIISTPNQPAGNPDTDGDGNGVYMSTGYPIYETGIVMMAIATSRAPDREVNSPGSPVDGWTYKEVLQDMVDYMAFGQCDSGTGRGGWRYSPNSGADNSCSGFAVSGLGYAESPRYGFNCTIPQFVKDELKIWIDYIQIDGGSDDGGSGYTSPNGANILRTGNLIFEMTFAGILSEDPNMQRALDYISRNWDYGWSGDCQAMYCTANGLWYSQIHTIVVDGNERDWHADFADNLVDIQQSTGYWYSSYGNILGTEWALIALEMTTSGPIPPSFLTKIDDVNDGDCVGPGDEIIYTIDYNSPAGPNLPDYNDVTIVDYLPDEVDFNDASGSYTHPDSNTVVWNIGTLHHGDSGSVTLTVNVKPCVEPGATITNECEIKSGEQLLSTVSESTTVCGPLMFSMEEIFPDGNCVGPGDEIIYSICYNANGYSDTNVAITDELSNDVKFVSATGDYDYTDGKVIWDIGTLGPNDSNCFILTVSCKSPDSNSITNYCEMRGNCISLVFAQETTPVCPNMPELSKVDDVNGCEYAWPNDYITYSLCYSANGYGDTNVVITDELPDEVNFVWASGDYNRPDTNTVIWDIGTLNPGDSNCLTLKVKVKADVEPDTIITNQCWMTGEYFDLTAEENTPLCTYAGLYVDEVMTDEPVLYIRFEEDDPRDWSGNNCWVDKGNSVIIEKTAGSLGKAAYLRGSFSGSGSPSSSYWIAAANQVNEPCLPAQFGHQYAFAPNDITFELWVRSDMDKYYVDSLARLFDQTDGNEIYAPALGKNDYSDFRYLTPYGEDGSEMNYWGYTTSEGERGKFKFDDKWHHVVLVYDEQADGNNYRMRISTYIDGRLVKSKVYPSDDYMGPTEGLVGPEMDHIVIGGTGSRDNVSMNWGGYYDEFAIYPKVLSPCRVASHYAAWWAKNCNELWDRELIGMQPGIDPNVAKIDLNRDCIINFYDFAHLAEEWMLCNDPNSSDPDCIPNWQL
ncbi:MAG: LamG-like jellyroll fold domain-containing protein [Phycisphaerae bacterium]